MPAPATITTRELLGDAAALRLDAHGSPVDPVTLVDLDELEGLDPREVDGARDRTVRCAGLRRILVGVRSRPLNPAYLGPGQYVLDRMTTTLTPFESGPDPREFSVGARGGDAMAIRVPDPYEAARTIRDNAAAHPSAALALDTLLRINASASVREGIIAESLAFTLLLAGDDHRRWRAENRSRLESHGQAPPGSALVCSADGRVRHLGLDWTRGCEGIDVHVQESLRHALAHLAPKYDEVVLRALGADFSPLFVPDPLPPGEDIPTAHMLRLGRHVGAAAHCIRDRLVAQVRGSCVGVGLEVAGFAHRLEASPDATFALPQLHLGLIPGAGGTVSLTRRMGRWRVAYLAFSALPVDAATALRWHLVDELTA